jgi:glycosyltransferase involved in cell wall biosynthesis
MRGASENPLVSVVIPAYNAEEYVAAALDSVFAQDWQPIEVIVVDDGSSDGTGTIVQSFPGIRYIRQENAGAAAARNTAIAHSRGEFVANFDADDLLPPYRLRVQAEHLLAHPEVGCVFGRQQWLSPPPWLPRDAVDSDLDGPLTTAMFRRDVLVALGGYDESYARGEDLDLVVRMREHSIRFELLPDVLLYRRYHGDSLSAGRSSHENLIRSLRGKLQRSGAGGGEA